jgi:dihydroxyacid dehydratase/phosphogluconate dehydratase
MAGHLAPEAARGGPIAAVRDGDEITPDVEARRLDVALSDAEIADWIRDYRLPERPTLEPRQRTMHALLRARLRAPSRVKLPAFG